MTPRPYQTEILDSVKRGWKDFRKQLVIAPTGSGKALLFCWMCQAEVDAGRRALILVDQNELAWQALDKLKRSTGIDGQLEKAEFSASKFAPVVVSTIQSMARRLSSWPHDHFDLVLADEADKSISDSWQSVLKHFDGTARVCGFTATPNRTDKRTLGEYYDNIACEISLFDLIKQGFLAPVCVRMAPIKIDLQAVHITDGDYNVNELDHAITPYLSSAVQAIKEFASDRKTLVFLPLIKTSETFVALARSAGLAAEHIDGTSEDRAEKLKRFDNDQFSLLANSSLLTRGYDQPDIDCIVMLRPTKSSTLFQQCIGRGTRIAEGKENLLIIDFLYQTSKHVVCRPASLIAESEEEAEQMEQLAEAGRGEEMDLLELQSSAKSEREQKLADKLKDLANRKAKYITAEQFALQHHRLEIAEWQPTMHWHSDPLTPKQTEWIEKAGVDPSSVNGKGQASQILDVYFRQKEREPASHKQRWVMSQHGWRSPDGLRGPFDATRKEATEFFAKLNKAQAA